jgi:hypothetical protein
MTLMVEDIITQLTHIDFNRVQNGLVLLQGIIANENPLEISDKIELIVIALSKLLTGRVVDHLNSGEESGKIKNKIEFF